MAPLHALIAAMTFRLFVLFAALITRRDSPLGVGSF
jgi:hypothetical protein